jgi:hypothetical protein
MIARKCEATCTWNVEPSFFVASFIGKRNADSANGINDFLECTEIDIDVVIDCDAKILIDGVNKPVWVFALKRGVDSVRSC